MMGSSVSFAGCCRMPRKQRRINSSPITPTAEQEAALALFQTGESLRLLAFAGAGKTTTLSLLSHSTAKSGLYLTYANSIANAARRRFPTTVDCRTTHSLAWRAVQGARGYTQSKMNARVFPQQLKQDLGLQDRNIGDMLTLDGRQLAYLVLETIRRYCYSSHEDLSVAHVVSCGRLTGISPDARQELNEWVLATAQQVWAMMTSVTHPMPLGHDGYQKLWGLSHPILSCDYLLLDEAQDTNEVVLGVLREQQCQLVYVGDPYQQIYEWRGAVNAMEQLPTQNTAALTRSFRFGEPIATAATMVLRTLGETRSIQGSPHQCSTVSHEGSARTVLARTNYGVFAEVIEALDRGLSVFVIGGVRELGDLIDDVKGLQNGRPAKQPELFGFRAWRDVLHYVQGDEGQHLRKLVGVVAQHGTEKLQAAAKRVVQNENDAERIVSTAHRAKGREWDDVRMVPGFSGSLATSGQAPPEDIRLFYVAMTRASRKLVVDEAELAAFQSMIATCPNGHRMRVSTALCGRHGHCTLCRAEVDIPPAYMASEKIVFFCPNGHRLRVPRDMAGREGRCTRCDAEVMVPSR